MNGINPNAAASAYSNSQKITGAGQITELGSEIKGIGQGVNNDVETFADFMKQNISQAVETMKSGEEMSAKAIAGKASTIDVVQAVTSAELTLQTVVAVRDKMIGAYQEIMRMPI
ncbi:MAG: flagellar hook-basal body complex protein FliE [Zetaproteobacteria bacterium]|nr:MAG: flagellar hook-basal body complex protein FliE [Zetaproteobacteria bacterium]